MNILVQLLLILITSMTTFAYADTPLISSKWQETELNKDACVSAAKQAIEQAGIFTDIVTVEESVFAQYQDYTAAIRCIGEKGVIFFLVAGPPPPETGRQLREELEKYFTRSTNLSAPKEKMESD